MAPGGTPQPVVERMVQASMEAAKDPYIIDRFNRLGIAPDGTTQSEFVDVLRRDKSFYSEAIAAAGIKIKPAE